MCAFNPFLQPFKRMITMLAHNDPTPQSLGLKGEVPKPLIQKTLLQVPRLPISNPLDAQAAQLPSN